MAQSVIGALRVTLGLDSAQFGRDAKRAQTSAKGLNDQLQSFAGTMQKVGAGLSVVSAGIVAVFRSQANAAAQVGRLATLANTGVVEFQRLSVAARSVGIEQDKLSDILKDVNDKVGDFLTTGAGPMADFFEQIAPRVGVTAEQFRNLSGADALQLYVSSLEKANLSQAEMTFFLEAIANDATALIPILANGGAEMNRLADAGQRAGAIFSEETVAASREFQDSLRQVGLVTQGVVQQVLADLAPAMAAIAESVADLATRFATLSPEARMFATVAAGVTAAVGPLALAIGTAIKAILALRVAMLAFAGPVGVAVALIATGAAAFLLLRDNSQKVPPPVDEARTALALLNETMGTFSSSAAPSAQTAALNTATAYRDQAAAAISAAEAQLALMEAELAAQRAAPMEGAEGGLLRDMVEGNLAEDVAFATEEINSLRNSLDLARSRIRQAAGEITSQMGPAMRETAGATEELNVELTGLDEVLDRIGAAGGARGVSIPDVTAGLGDMAEGFKPVESAVGSVSDAFGNFLAGGLQDFTGFANEILGGFQRLLADMIATAARNRIMIAIGAGGSATGTAASAAGSAVTGPGGIAGIAGALGPAGIAIAGGAAILGGIFAARRRRRQARAARKARNAEMREAQELEILELQGDTEAVRERQLQGLNRPQTRRQREIWALQDAQRIANEREGIERRLLELQGDTVELRKRELDALDPANRALAERAFALADEARIADERRGLEERLLQLAGQTDELRRREIAALDQSNRGLLETIFNLEDMTAQFEALQRSLSARFDLSSKEFLTAFDARFAQATAARDLATTPADLATNDPQLRALQDLMRKQLKVLEDIQYTGIPSRA